LVNGENAFLSNIGDKLSYTSNLIKLLEDKRLRKAIGDRGRETSRKYFDYVNNTKMFRELIDR
jgi:hypothetical protein